ncbi:MAG: DUF1343 domain-containing protein, partial [Rhodothermaceae bacterium]|nr:DUF1343 domain-containing protein [Rhodothermaceae bacterium]
MNLRNYTFDIVKWAALGCLFLSVLACTSGTQGPNTPEPNTGAEPVVLPPFQTGAEVLVAADFTPLAGKRVGLIVNHTAIVGDEHIIDAIHRAPDVELVALFGPEHGIRGDEDAGAQVQDGIDQQSGVPIYSLYQGDTRKPAPESLQGIDVLVFDIQDIGARFYTYISTLGLAMQAAAEQNIAFMVLDRPNPLGGEYVSGYVLEEANTSFVGQYTIPVAHGMTTGELARLIKGEAYLEGLENLEVSVVEMEGWSRNMTWDQLNRPWIPTSPNIPDVETAFVYAGTCFFEAVEASEGRGTRTPFVQVGSTWGNADDLVATLDTYQLEGVDFEPIEFTPMSIEGMSSNPRFKDQQVQGVKQVVTDYQAYRPIETGIHVLHAFYTASPEQADFINERWLRLLAGTDRLRQALVDGSKP